MPSVSLPSSLLLLAPLLLAGCGDTATYSDAPATDQPPVEVGQKVTIEFRRDALGAAHDLPIAPRTSSINGALLVVSGEVKEVRPGWVLISVPSESLDPVAKPSLCWIPMTVVLAIDVK